jgi:hypothetical protein
VNTIVCPPYNYFLSNLNIFVIPIDGINIETGVQIRQAAYVAWGRGTVLLYGTDLTSPDTGLNRPAKAGKYLVWKIERKPIDQLVDNLLTVLLVIVIT